jgi:hypothetical protein
MTGRRARRLAAVVALAAALGLGGLAAAATVRIDTGGDPDARLELRTVALPGGGERRLYVVTAERVTVTTDALTVVAERLEFDPDAGTVRIVGRGRVERAQEVLVGDDLVVELTGGRLDGDDVLVITDRVDVLGARAQRIEGRIRIGTGRFSPCGRCGQRTEDYAFEADRIEILPGDRLIAWRVVVLVRDAPLLRLPLLVLPLAEPERSPRLAIRSGDADERAEVALDWPYVAGPNAFGTFRARLLLDVDPEASGPLDGGLLGGRPERAYLAGGLVHRFYDGRGAGAIELDAEPAFVTAEDEPPDEGELRFEARYETDAASGDPEVAWRVARDDERRPDLVEAELRLAASDAWRAELSSRVALPLAPEVATDPSWDGRSEPRTTPVRLALDAAPSLPLRAGSLRLEELSVDLGAFEDAPDPTNRSAAGRPRSRSGRAELRHRLALDRVSLLGVELSGDNEFRGRYYATGERQVDWRAELRGRLDLGGIGELELQALRDTAEGETPFAFDRIPLRTRSELAVRASLRPFDGVRLRGEAGLVLEDDRRPDEVGLRPTELRLDAFTTLAALDVSLTHRAEPRRGDVGTLRGELAARAPGGRFVAELAAEGLLDLAPALPPDAPEEDPRDVTEAEASLELGLRDVLVARAEATWTRQPRDEDEPSWAPLDLALTAGTLERGDRRPGLRAFWSVEPETGRTRQAGYELAVDAGPLRAELEQRFGPAGEDPGTHRLALVWTDVARATLEGVELLPAGVLGLAPDPDATRRLALRIEDEGAGERTRFEAELRTRRTGPSDARERQGTVFEARLRLAERAWSDGRVRIALDGFLDVPLPDDAQPSGYLRRANLELGLDLAGRVGLQGTFGYRGSYDTAREEVRSGRLSFEEVSLVVRASQELVLGATLDDVWELVDEEPGDLALDPRPTLFAAWDRCCWALFASWDTRSGEVVLTLGAPGAAEGPQLTFDEGPTLPWREEDTP